MESQTSEHSVSIKSNSIQSSNSLNNNNNNKEEEIKIEKLLQTCKSPWLYCYPRSRAHSSLLTCYRTLENSIKLPQQIKKIGNIVSFNKISRGNNNNNENEISVKKRVVEYIYPGSQVPLVSESTVSMIEAFLKYLQIPKGSFIFLPGLLMYPYFNLLELFDRYMLRVIGYDINFVTMCVDEVDLKQKVSKIRLSSEFKNQNSIYKNNNNKKSQTKGKIINEVPVLFFFFGVNGRFINNIENVINFVRQKFYAITIELHPITPASFTMDITNNNTTNNNKIAMYADIHITSMDSAGDLGGSIAFTNDPLIQEGILLHLQKQSISLGEDYRKVLIQHIIHLLLSDGVSFQLVLRALYYWSFLEKIMTKISSSKRNNNNNNNNKNSFKKKEEDKEKKELKVNDTTPEADRIFAFLLKSRLSMIRNINIEEDKEKKISSTSSNKSKNIETISNLNKLNHFFFSSQPHPGLLAWMMSAINEMHRRVKLESFSLWEFLTRLRSDIEVISAGEAATPSRCVHMNSDSILIRVHSPQLAARALRSVGFDATAAIPYIWKSNNNNNNNNNNKTIENEKYSFTIRTIVTLPDCVECENVAQHTLFVPLYPEMKVKNRDKMHRVMQSTFPTSLFMSPSIEFHKHVQNATSRHHAYRSTEVDALIASVKQSRNENSKVIFSDSQPLLLWILLGPIPGYLLSKL